MTIKELLKAILELLHQTKNAEDRYHLVMAHNELMEVYNRYENDNNQ